MSSFIVGHNYALVKTASQSTTYEYRNDFKAEVAVDGVTTLGQHSHTEFISNQWWKVDFGKTIIFQYARIYPRAVDICGIDSNIPCGKLVNTAAAAICSTVLKKKQNLFLIFRFCSFPGHSSHSDVLPFSPCTRL